MNVTHLLLKDFRNHEVFSYQGDAQIILLEGLNGTGKTSILEALSLLCPGKGLKNVNFDDAVKRDCKEWSLFVNLKDSEDEATVGMSCYRNGRRVIKVNNKFIKSSISLLDLVKVLWLTPAEDNLLAESKLLRRKFLDRLTYNFDVMHAQNIIQYEYFLKSRLKLLKNGNYDIIWLNRLELNLSELSLKIAQSRLKTINRLKEELLNNDFTLTTPEININCKISNDINILSIEDLQKEFEDFRGLDAKVGRSLYGIHRADFVINNSFKHINASKSSTGELKAMLLSLILAQITSLNRIENINPLLLLDDIFSHLDTNKINSLFRQLLKIKAQIWISGINFNNIKQLRKCKNFIKILI